MEAVDVDVDVDVVAVAMVQFRYSRLVLGFRCLAALHAGHWTYVLVCEYASLE